MLTFSRSLEPCSKVIYKSDGEDWCGSALWLAASRHGIFGAEVGTSSGLPTARFACGLDLSGFPGIRGLAGCNNRAERLRVIF